MINHRKHVNSEYNGKQNSRYIEGIINISGKGFGIVRIKNSDEIIEIDHNFLRTACHGDTIKILLHPKRQNSNGTGEVIEIIRRSKKLEN